MNNQKPEPRDKGDGSILDIHSIFYTIQGEGPFSGHRAIFVRLAGCNLQCPGCDTEYTKGRKQHDYRFVATTVQALAEAQHAPDCLVVITGGEPLRQNIGLFVNELVTMGHHVQIESNGFFAPCGTIEYLVMANWVTLVVSPKTSRINELAYDIAGAFKYVLDHREVDPDDGLPIRALDHPAPSGVARPRPGVNVYLSPFDAKDETINQLNLKACAESCLRHGHTLGVQLHKLIGYE